MSEKSVRIEQINACIAGEQYHQYPDTKASDTAPESHLSARVPWLPSQTDMLSEDWNIVE